VETVVGVGHKYKRNLNAANLYESLLLEKYPFSSWTPFDENSITAHLATYIYTVIPVFLMALKSGSVTSTLIGTLIYTSLQFKFVSKSLEELNNMEDSDTQIQQNTCSSLNEQHTCEKSNYRNFPVSATDGESFQTPSQAQIPECCNKHKNTDTSITTAHRVNEELNNMEDSDSQIQQNTFSSLNEQQTCEESNYRNFPVSATDGESFQTPSQAQIHECCNKHKYRDTSITTAHRVKDQEHMTDSDRLPSDNKSSPEDCVISIIKNHQEAIR
jgi:hypothetical protein